MEELRETGFVYRPGKEDVISQNLHIFYNGEVDEYYKMLTNQKTVILSRGWTSFVNSYENISRSQNPITKEFYLERTEKRYNSRVKWRLDFTSSGLVVDEVSLMVHFKDWNGGTVVLQVTGDPGMDNVSYTYAGANVVTKQLCESKTLSITASLLGEQEDEGTQLLNASANGIPFSLQVKLKLPCYTFGRSFILIGLMRSQEKISEIIPRNKAAEKSDGYLYIHIEKCKHLPCRRNGSIAKPKIKWKIFSKSIFDSILTTNKDQTQLAKTKVKQERTLDPKWNEYLSMTDVNDLESAELLVKVAHKRFFRRTYETLGHVALTGGKKTKKPSYYIKENARKLQKNGTTNTITDVNKNESHRKANNNESGLEALRLSEINEISDEINRTNTNQTSMKRSMSLSDMLSSDKRKLSRSVYRSGSVSNLLEDGYLESKVSEVAGDQWRAVIERPNKWVYCWHSLMGVENVMQ